MDIYVKMGQKERLVERKGFLKEFYTKAGIYCYLILEWIHLKEGSIVMFLVLSAVKELL